MFGVLLAEKSHRAGYFGYFPSIYVFNLKFNQIFTFFNSRRLLEDSFFFRNKVIKLIKSKVVPLDKLIKQ